MCYNKDNYKRLGEIYMENNFVNMLVNRFFIELEKNDRSGIYAMTQRNLTYNSNKIEGSTLTEKQTASIFETGTILSENELIRSKDVEEATGHFMMFNKMLETYKEPLTHEIIKQYHYKLKIAVWEDMLNGYPVGEYKTRANKVANIVTALPNEVEERMTNLLSVYNKKEKHTIEDIAEFHASYEMIHPFQDGNGRTGRIILFKECLKNDIIPFIIEDKNKGLYYEALNDKQTNGNIDKLIALFKQEQKVYYDLGKDFVIPFKS